MLFSLNLTVVVFVISFLVFMWALNEVFLKPVGKVLEERAKLIEDKAASGKAAHQEAGHLQDNYEAELKKIREEAQATIAKATEEANHARAAMLRVVADEGMDKLDKAKADISAERAQLIDALVAQEQDLVEAITRKVLGDDSVNIKIDESDVRRTLEEAC